MIPLFAIGAALVGAFAAENVIDSSSPDDTAVASNSSSSGRISVLPQAPVPGAGDSDAAASTYRQPTALEAVRNFIV